MQAHLLKSSLVTPLRINPTDGSMNPEAHGVCSSRMRSSSSSSSRLRPRTCTRHSRPLPSRRRLLRRISATGALFHETKPVDWLVNCAPLKSDRWNELMHPAPVHAVTREAQPDVRVAVADKGTGQEGG